MKAAIYTPYLETLGGGERYMLSIAQVLVRQKYLVNIQGASQVLLKAAERFSMNLNGIRAVDNVDRGNGYDVCVWLSDGSVPTLYARKNFLHFQRPFYKVQGRSLINRAKFFRIKQVLVNSQFTKEWIDKEYPVESTVLYPPVDVKKFKAGQKEKVILYVGRFSQLEQAKRQDVLIESFKKFHDNFDKSWRLVLAGGSDVGRGDFVDALQKSSQGYPIEILENVSFVKLKQLFAKAKIFWSAAGFGIDEQKNPEKMEHFGMVVVEAMSAGCIPLVYNAGGHKEIISNDINGYLWNSSEELIVKTAKLLKDPGRVRELAAKTKRDSNNFSYENFEKNFLSIL